MDQGRHAAVLTLAPETAMKEKYVILFTLYECEGAISVVGPFDTREEARAFAEARKNRYQLFAIEDAASYAARSAKW